MPVSPSVGCCPSLASSSSSSAQKYPGLDNKCHGHSGDRKKDCDKLLNKEQTFLLQVLGPARSIRKAPTVAESVAKVILRVWRRVGKGKNGGPIRSGAQHWGLGCEPEPGSGVTMTGGDRLSPRGT